MPQLNASTMIYAVSVVNHAASSSPSVTSCQEGQGAIVSPTLWPVAKMFFLLENFLPKKLGLEIPIWRNLRAKLNFWAFIMFSVGNLQASVCCKIATSCPAPNFLTHDLRCFAVYHNKHCWRAFRWYQPRWPWTTLNRKTRVFQYVFRDFRLPHTFQEWTAPKLLEINQENLHTKCSALNVYFNSAGFHPPSSRIPLCERIKFVYPLPNARFLLLSTNLARERLQIDSDLLPIIRSTADDLSGGTNIDDLERPWNRKMAGFGWIFLDFRLRCIFKEGMFAEITRGRPSQHAYEIKLLLSRVLWILAQISCYLRQGRLSLCDTVRLFIHLHYWFISSVFVSTITQKLQADFPEIFREGKTWPRLEVIKFRWCCRLANTTVKWHSVSGGLRSLTAHLVIVCFSFTFTILPR